MPKLSTWVFAGPGGYRRQRSNKSKKLPSFLAPHLEKGQPTSSTWERGADELPPTLPKPLNGWEWTFLGFFFFFWPASCKASSQALKTVSTLIPLKAQGHMESCRMLEGQADSGLTFYPFLLATPWRYPNLQT